MTSANYDLLPRFSHSHQPPNSVTALIPAVALCDTGRCDINPIHHFLLDDDRVNTSIRPFCLSAWTFHDNLYSHAPFEPLLFPHLPGLDHLMFRGSSPHLPSLEGFAWNTLAARLFSLCKITTCFLGLVTPRTSERSLYYNIYS